MTTVLFFPISVLGFSEVNPPYTRDPEFIGEIEYVILLQESIHVFHFTSIFEIYFLRVINSILNFML